MWQTFGMEAERLAGAWSARDHARALVPEDHAAIDATLAARVAVIEQLRRGAHADLFHACLVLGRLLAERGGSPTLAAATMDGAFEETGAAGEATVSARASLAEGYAAARIDRGRREAVAAWDFPRCAVRVDKDTMAFMAGPPDDDDDALGEWAARVAGAATRAKVRHAIVGGADKPRRVLSDALDLAGIEVMTERGERDRGSSSLFRIPWLRRGNR